MLKEETEKELTVPEWVKGLFKDDSPSNPTVGMSLPSKDSQMVSYAQTEAHLASLNLEHFTDQTKIDQERFRLSYNLMILGEFEKALDYADTKELKDKIKQYKKAVSEWDDKFCDCEDDVTQLQRVKIPLSRFRTVQRIYSPVHKKVVDIKKCMKCGFINATDYLTPTEQIIAKKVSAAEEGDSDEKVFQ